MEVVERKQRKRRKQLVLANHALAWVFSCKLAGYCQTTFPEEQLWRAASFTLEFLPFFDPLGSYEKNSTRKNNLIEANLSIMDKY